MEAISDAGIQVLVDEYVRISDDLVLLGREDPGEPGVRKGAPGLAGENPDPTAFLYVAGHQSYAETADIVLEADL